MKLASFFVQIVGSLQNSCYCITLQSEVFDVDVWFFCGLCHLILHETSIQLAHISIRVANHLIFPSYNHLTVIITLTKQCLPRTSEKLV